MAEDINQVDTGINQFRIQLDLAEQKTILQLNASSPKMNYRTTIHSFLICLALGLAVDRLADFSKMHLSEVDVALPTASSEVLVVTSKLPFSGFEAVAHACGGRTKDGGGGYTTSYRSDEMVSVSISGLKYASKLKALKSIDGLIAESVEVIEDSRAAPDASSTFRLLLRFDYSGKPGFTILKYDGDKFYETIDSRQLETARKFEAWNEISRNLK